MAKIRGPLHSISASGTIGKIAAFRSTRRGAVCAQKPRSYRQVGEMMIANQMRMRAARAAFRTLPTTDRSLWNQLAARRGIPAWQCFFSEWQYQMVEPPSMPLIPEPTLNLPPP